jgi:hypothetical protein
MISFFDFKKYIFNNISEKEKNFLFYWSLFDQSSWEDLPTPSYLPKFKRAKTQVLKILSKNKKFFKKYINADKKEFYTTFVISELLTNFLLAAQVKKKMGRKIKGVVDKYNLERRIFPDMIIKGTKIGHVYIEIKGITSASDLKDRIETDVINKIRKYKRKYDKLLLLLLFPILSEDNHDRIYQLIKGYYVYENFLGNPEKAYRKVLCNCIAIKSKTYMLNKLVARILNYLSNKNEQ